MERFCAVECGLWLCVNAVLALSCSSHRNKNNNSKLKNEIRDSSWVSSRKFSTRTQEYFNEVANCQTSLSLSQLRLIIRITEAIIKFLLDDFSRSKCGVVQVRRKQLEIFPSNSIDYRKSLNPLRVESDDKSWVCIFHSSPHSPLKTLFFHILIDINERARKSKAFLILSN